MQVPRIVPFSGLRTPLAHFSDQRGSILVMFKPQTARPPTTLVCATELLLFQRPDLMGANGQINLLGEFDE